MSLSALVSATESAVRMSEAAVSAAEESMAAARLASIHATSALAAARLALDLESRIKKESSLASQQGSESQSKDILEDVNSEFSELFLSSDHDHLANIKDITDDDVQPSVLDLETLIEKDPLSSVQASGLANPGSISSTIEDLEERLRRLDRSSDIVDIGDIARDERVEII